MLNERIQERLKALNKSVQRVSIEATGAKETLRKILDGTTKSPRYDTIEKIAAALETTPEWLLGGDGAAPLSAPIQTDVRFGTTAPPLPNINDMPKDLPVFGTAAGSHTRGAFQLTAGPVEFVRRPPTLAGVKGAYSLYVEGTSMEPQFWQGELVIVHPHKPPRFGDAVVVQCQYEEDSPVEATIGILAKRTEKIVGIEKHNPKAQIDLPRNSVIATHKILTMNELLGF